MSVYVHDAFEPLALFENMQYEIILGVLVGFVYHSDFSGLFRCGAFVMRRCVQRRKAEPASTLELTVSGLDAFFAAFFGCLLD